MKHPLTPTLTSDNWQEELNPQALSLDELVTLLADFKNIEAFGAKVGGFLKEAIRGKVPRDEHNEGEFVGTYFAVRISQRSRAGGLNKALILEEMGGDWVEEHSTEPTVYEEIRLKEITIDP